MATGETTTDQLLLPGQQFSIGTPWERAAPPPPPAKGSPPAVARGGNALDDENDTGADPMAGLEIGSCEVIRRLSPGSVRSLLAMRTSADATSLVVMKRLELPDAAAPELQARAQWASRLQHPNLARVFGCESSDEGVFWVSELMSGATFAELSAACRKVGKSLPLGFSLAAIHEAALALGELHQTPADMHGLVNDRTVAVTFSGVAKLLDVGLFRSIVGQPLWADEFASSQAFLAPEQVLMGRYPDAKTDVYALGVVLYEAITSQRLCRANSFDERMKWHKAARIVPPSTLNLAINRELQDVVLKALEPDRAKRFANGAELAAALKRAAAVFMWRPNQRASFVTDLFRTRQRREQVLMLGCGPRTSQKLPIVGELPKPMELPAKGPPFDLEELLQGSGVPDMLEAPRFQVVQPVAVEGSKAIPPTIKPRLPKLKSSALKTSRSRKAVSARAVVGLVLTAIVVGGAIVLGPHLKLDEAWAKVTSVASAVNEWALAQAYHPLMQGPKVWPPEPVKKAPLVLAPLDVTPPAEVVAAAPKETAVKAAPSAKAKAPAAKRKKKGDAPLPPWLR